MNCLITPAPKCVKIWGIVSTYMYMTDIRQLPEQPIEPYVELFNMFENITFTKKAGASNRRGFPENHLAMTFGLVWRRFDHKADISAHTKKYPEIWAVIKQIGDATGWVFSSVHVNKNVLCPPHKDSKNAGKTLLVAFGDYTGGESVVEGTAYDIDLKPVIFDGCQLTHWTAPFKGTRYSLVFYNHSLCKDLI